MSNRIKMIWKNKTTSMKLMTRLIRYACNRTLWYENLYNLKQTRQNSWLCFALGTPYHTGVHTQRNIVNSNLNQSESGKYKHIPLFVIKKWWIQIILNDTIIILVRFNKIPKRFLSVMQCSILNITWYCSHEGVRSFPRRAFPL